MKSGQAVYVSPSRGDATIYQGEGGIGVDIDGTIVASSDTPPTPLNTWKRYIVGSGNLAAMCYRELRLVVHNSRSDELRVQLDNIHILQADGTLIPAWSKGPTPKGATPECSLEISSYK